MKKPISFGFVLLVFVGFLLVAQLFNSPSNNSGAKPSDNSAPTQASTPHIAAPIPPPEPPESPCKSDWSKCADNEDLANNYREYSYGQASCKVAANKKAKYGSPEWPWLAFSTFLKGRNYVDTGVAVIIEDDAQFQNQFGAKAHVSVRCKYNLKTQSVLSIDIDENR